MKTNNKVHKNSPGLESARQSRSFSRRNFLQLSALGLGGILLSRCTLPPPNPSPISWQPHALTPVFYGLREYGTADGAPGKCRVFFPTVDGSPDSAAILPGRYPYPLILFAHGQCFEADHYKKWFHLPAQLAKCGYVVVVPDMPGMSGSPSDPNHPALTRMTQMVDWMRTGWQHKNLVRAATEAGSTGVIGHSYGALLGSRFATANSISAYASLGGVWHEWTNGTAPIFGLNKPMFLVWGSNDVPATINDATWNALPKPKHKAVFDRGEHWDYLRPGTTTCEKSRGPCTLNPILTQDLISMFFAKYLVPTSTTSLSHKIPESLIPPPLQLTFEQEFYAGSHLKGFPFTSSSGCSLALSWNTYYGTGSEQKP